MPAKSRASAPNASEILAGMTIAVVVLDADLKIVYLNPAAQSLFGLSERVALGKSLDALLTPADELVGLCRRSLTSGLTIGLTEFAARIGTREVNLDCTAAPFDGERGVLLEVSDTARHRMIKRDADFVATQKLSRRIVRQLAHEVKNPLGGMRGAAQLLERQLPSKDLKEYTEVIIAEADRLAALVDSILQPGTVPVPREVNLHEITEHVADLIAAEKPPGVELLRDYDPSLPPVYVDRDQMIQAFLNLARNGLQAVGEQGRLIFRTRALANYTLGAKQHRLVLSAEVEDDGPGIPEELQDTVFYPLVTSKNSGTGLGLTIAQDLASRNNGLIEFTSQPGRTIFRLRIPVSRAGAEARAGTAQ